MSKIQSRKLWAWLTWTALIAFAMLKNLITPEIIQWYGAVTCIYIGGQAYLDSKKSV